MSKDNQDHFKRGGRSGGPTGPLSQFKKEFTQQKTHLSPDEFPHPQAEPQQEGKRAPAKKRSKAHSVLDDLPKPVGAAGVPSGQKPLPSPEASEPVEDRDAERPAASVRARDAGVEAVRPALEYALPTQEPTEERALLRVSRGLLRPIARRVGKVALLIDRPVRRTHDALVWLSDAARER